MVQRALLTQKFVDEAAPPPRGERWISDTRQRGFGLRILVSAKGEIRKSYCVRLEQNGNARRCTFDANYAAHEFIRLHWWEMQHGERQDPSLGELIDYARAWANDEVASICGTPTLSAEQAAQLARSKRRIAILTFERAAEHVLDGMMFRGLSQAYRDRLYKLFSAAVPKSVAMKNICDVTLDDVSSLLSHSALRPGSQKILRPFVGQVLEVPTRFGLRGMANSYRFRRLQTKEWRNKRAGQIEGWSESDFSTFLENVEKQQDKWQQALCLRMYFEVDAPLSRVMSARWDQIQVQQRTSNEFIGAPAGPILRWRHREGLRGWHPLRDTADRVVEKCFRLHRASFPRSPYLFPSPAGRKFDHIRSVDHVWNAALHDRKLKYISPREFKLAAHEAFPWRGFNWDWVSPAWWEK